MFNNLRKNSMNRFSFISVGVWAVLTFLVSIKNFEQYKNLPKDKLRKQNQILPKIFQSMQNVLSMNASLLQIYYLMDWSGNLDMTKTFFS